MKYPFFFKVDDFSDTSNLDIFKKFYEICKKYSVHADIGIIARTIESEKIKEFIETNTSEYIHYFRHGHLHVKQEFASGKDIYHASTTICKIFEKYLFGKELDRLGAPFNMLEPDIIAIYYSEYPFSVIYYPDYDYKKNTLNVSYTSMHRYISFKYHASIERKSDHYNPSFAYFEKTYEKRIKRNLPFVIQIHPDRWNDTALVEIEKLIMYLKEHGYESVSPNEFINILQDNPWMDSLAQKFSVLDTILNKCSDGWHSSKYNAGALSDTNCKLKNILSVCSIPYPVETIYDIGCGVGDWFFLINHFFPQAHKIGIEINKTFQNDCNRILNTFDVRNTNIIGKLPSTNTRLAYPANLTICNRALNYINLIDYCIFIHNNSDIDSHHYIAIHNMNFYLSGLKEALITNNAKLSSARCNVLLSSLQYFFGSTNRITNEVSHYIQDITEILNLFDFNIIDTYIDDNNLITNIIFHKSDDTAYSPDNSFFKRIFSYFNSEKNINSKEHSKENRGTKINSIGLKHDLQNKFTHKLSNYGEDKPILDNISPIFSSDLIKNKKFAAILASEHLQVFAKSNPFAGQMIKIICLFYINNYTACIEEINNLYANFKTDISCCVKGI